MTTRSRISAWLLLLPCHLVAWAACAAEPPVSVQGLYILECGESRTQDLSANWSPGAHQGEAWEFSDNCYLIKHAKGWFMWDSGMSDSIAEKQEGVTVGNGLLTLFVRKTLASQLQQLNIAPTDITHLALSHFHSDHAGNANLFTAATLYLQSTEYEAAFGADAGKFGFQPALYDKLRANSMKKLSGDFDVFGDGAIQIISTSGHTPGHQSLLVRLPKRGAVILTGDLVHFADNWEHQRVPSRNFDKERSVASMQRIAQLLKEQHAELWINHDKVQSGTLPKAPVFIE